MEQKKNYHTLVIGTGCAGFNAADRLYDLGVTDVAIITEGRCMGTSRNTGSDKQTYCQRSRRSKTPFGPYQPTGFYGNGV